MLKFFVKLLLCLTMFSLPGAGKKSSERNNESPSPKEEPAAAANSQPVTFLAPDAFFEGTLKSEGDVEIRGIHFRIKSVIILFNNTSCDFQRTIEESVPNATAVLFHVEGDVCARFDDGVGF